MKKEVRKLIRKILSEIASDQIKNDLYSKSGERKPYNKNLMKQAIENGSEVGLLFKSDNEDYTMPTSKYRIIWPVALGISKKGNESVRGYHIIGQSEGEAIKSGVRSAEAENAWRLFNVKNIKGMWLTGRNFDSLPSDYNPNDKSMSSVEIAFNSNKAKSKQKIQTTTKPENNISTDIDGENELSQRQDTSNILNKPNTTVIGNNNLTKSSSPTSEPETEA